MRSTLTTRRGGTVDHDRRAPCRQARRRCRRLLLQLAATSGLAGEELGKLGDARSNELVLTEIDRFRPGDAVLSEEAKDSSVRVSADRVWIIDLLDGTAE